MSYRFGKETRDTAREQNNYLVGVHVVSAQPQSGIEVKYETPALSYEEAMNFINVCRAVFDGTIDAAKLVEVIEQQEPKKRSEVNDSDA